MQNQDESLGEEDEEEDEMFSSFRTVMSPYSSKSQLICILMYIHVHVHTTYMY